MFELSTAAAAIGAERLGADARVLRVVTDSRDVRSGDLFVALKGPRFDAHEFVDRALASGAVAAVVSNPDAVSTKGAALMVAPDTRLALGKLAAWWRSRFDIPVVGVTGSNGKTTVKEMIAAVLRKHSSEGQVLATEGNLNNDIGMPLTLLKLSDQHRYAVIEMGMNHLGEIAYLSRLARPDIALINNACTAHIGEVGSVEGIARAKGEIFEGLRPAGTAVINGDDAFADYWRDLLIGRTVVDFGLDRRATITARYELSDTGSLITVRTPAHEFVLRLQVPGRHNVKNAIAAAAVCAVLSVPPGTIAEGLSGYGGVRGRMQIMRLQSGAIVIDDTYNANPDSMKAALSVLGAAAGPRIFVVGDMGELGPGEIELHADVGSFARRAGIDRVYALGKAVEATVRAFGDGAQRYQSIEALLEDLRRDVGGEATVLVKGSRFMKMERVVDALAGRTANSHGGH
jgi:UDP-N-acetylmuramoyl-tripeptide--D-alanyl-D-alanine ligase